MKSILKGYFTCYRLCSWIKKDEWKKTNKNAWVYKGFRS